MNESIEPGTTPRMWTAARIAGSYVNKLNPNQLKRLEGQIITALHESEEALTQAREADKRIITDMEFKLSQCFQPKPESWQAAICEVTKLQSEKIQLESKVLALTEALEFAHEAAHMTYDNSKKQPFFDKYRKRYAKNGCFSQEIIIGVLAEALTPTTLQANEIRQRIRAEVVDQCIACIDHTPRWRNEEFHDWNRRLIYKIQSIKKGV